MEPLKREQKQEILKNAPTASPAELEEYEELLAKRFAKGYAAMAGIATGAAPAAMPDPDEVRLKSLAKKLFDHTP